MKQPEHPLKPAFGEAADKISAWRAQQTALLTEQQRERFVALRREQEQKQKEASDRQEATKENRIRKETRSQLFAHRHYRLTLFPDRSSKTFEEARAHAEHIVNTHDTLEIESLKEQDQKRADQFLEQVEADRERQRSQRENLTRYFNERAAQKDRERDRDDGDREY